MNNRSYIIQPDPVSPWSCSQYINFYWF